MSSHISHSRRTPTRSTTPTELERECVVDIALRWGTGYDTTFRSYVNIIATPKGGSHQLGFEQGLLKFLRAEVEKNARRLKAGTDKLEKDDVLAGLTAVLTVRLPEPQFEGQTKEILGTPAVRAIASSVIARGLAERFSSSKRRSAADAIIAPRYSNSDFAMMLLPSGVCTSAVA